MSSIFISYRREDSQALAGRLFDRLAARYGKDRVFRDIDAIDPGSRFSEVIKLRIAGCKALIAIIGKDWLDAKDDRARRRLDLPDDFVRAEIAEALAQNKLVIPVLVEGTMFPARNALPPEISALVDLNALPISDSRFDYDVGRLMVVVDKIIAPSSRRAPRAAAVRWVVCGALGVLVLSAMWFADRDTAPNTSLSRDQASEAAVARRQDQLRVSDAIVVFQYDLTNGWKIRNIGKGPAVDVLVSERSFAGTWSAPVRLPPLAPGEERRMDWLQHRNVDVLGARFSDVHNQTFSAICQHDKSIVQRGSVFPDWTEGEIRAHWKPSENVSRTAGSSETPTSREGSQTQSVNGISALRDGDDTGLAPPIDAAAALSEQQTARLLSQINEVARKLSYSGRYSCTGNSSQNSRVSHSPSADQDGYVHRVDDAIDPQLTRLWVRRVGEVRQYALKSKIVKVFDAEAHPPIFPEIFPDPVLVAKHYQLQQLELSTQAGRPCQRFLLRPRDALRYLHDLCMDVATSILLRVQSTDANQILEQCEFEVIDLGPPPAPELVVPEAKDGWRVEHTLPFDKWALRDPPAGFHMVGETTLRGTLNGRDAEQVFVTDGVAWVSVFIERSIGPSQLPSSKRRGSVSFYSDQRGRWRVTAVGEVPPATVRLIHSSLTKRE
jgi:negative regulator of sigma E activity